MPRGKLFVSDPLVAGNSFACAMQLDLTLKAHGRMSLNELCIYRDEFVSQCFAGGVDELDKPLHDEFVCFWCHGNAPYRATGASKSSAFVLLNVPPLSSGRISKRAGSR